jgi:hypothetical protein
MRKWIVALVETKRQQTTVAALAAKWSRRDLARAWNAWSVRVGERVFVRRLCERCSKNYRRDAFRNVLAQWARCVHSMMFEESRKNHISAQVELDDAKELFQNAADEFRHHEKQRIEKEEKKILEKNLRRALGWWTKSRLARAHGRWRETTVCRKRFRSLLKSLLRKKAVMILRHAIRKWSSESLRLGAKIELARASSDLHNAAGEFRRMKRFMAVEKLADRVRSVFEKRESRSMLRCWSMLKRHSMKKTTAINQIRFMAIRCSRRTITTAFMAWQEMVESMKSQRHAEERARRVAERALRHLSLRKESRAFQRWRSMVTASIESKKNAMTLLIRRSKEMSARGMASSMLRGFGKWKNTMVNARMCELDAAIQSSSATARRNMLGRIGRSKFFFSFSFLSFSLIFFVFSQNKSFSPPSCELSFRSTLSYRNSWCANLCSHVNLAPKHRGDGNTGGASISCGTTLEAVQVIHSFPSVERNSIRIERDS